MYFSKKIVKKNKLVLLIITLIVLIFSLNTSYAVWNTYSDSEHDLSTIFKIGYFDAVYFYDCSDADIVIDTAFYDKYMTFSDNKYTWKLNENDDIAYRQELTNMTSVGVIIKNDICYMVVEASYNLIYTGLPTIESVHNYRSLMPLTINYINNYYYNKNQIVKASNGNYYMAKWQTNTNPSIDASIWNKIEPVTPKNFHALEYRNNIADYSNPILSTITKSLIWDNHTIYNIGDTAIYNNQKYKSLKDNNAYNTPNLNAWAWTIIENE